MIAHLAYVICDRCGTPASEPVDDAKEARQFVPRDWARLHDARVDRRVDWCPDCMEALR